MLLIVYEIFVRSFRDSNGDGIGDIGGILQAQEYLRYLGVDVLWLTPVFPSPSFHGYDVVNYFDVNPVFGDLNDFKRLLESLHGKGMKLILDLPLNHTSVLHPWFKEKSKMYVWATDETDVNERREWDGACIWHPEPRGYYRGLFGACTPDLDYSKSEVRDMAKSVVGFWKKLGVDGFRFDAAKHFFNDHEKNLEFWREISTIAGRFNVAEVWDHPSLAVEYAKVLGYAFNFHLFGAIRKSVMEGEAEPVFSALMDVKGYLRMFFNFLSSHDTTRLASDIPDPKHRIFAYCMLFTLPGIPVVYYGEELGVPGIYDPHFTEDVLEPFPWTESMCGPGQTMWKSLRYTKPHHGYSVEYQQGKSGSFLEEFRLWSNFRSENAWIDTALLENLELVDNTIHFTLHGEKTLSVSWNFNDFVCRVS